MSWNDYVNMVSMRWKNKCLKHLLAKFCYIATIDFIWREHNNVIFSQSAKDVNSLIMGIKSLVRERILTMKGSSLKVEDEVTSRARKMSGALELLK